MTVWDKWMQPFGLRDVFLTHMELGNVKVGFDWTQFPRLIFQKHPQLFQPCPEGLRKENNEMGTRNVCVCFG